MELIKLIGMFAAFDDDPIRKWGIPRYVSDGHQKWIGRFEYGYPWVLEKWTRDMVTEYRWKPYDLHPEDAYQALYIQRGPLGGMIRMVVSTVHQPVPSYGIPPSCHMLAYAFMGGETSHFVRHGAALVYGDRMNVGRFEVRDFTVTGQDLISETCARIPDGIRDYAHRATTRQPA